jgi:glycerophosphodiester phosphodiesterase
MKFGHNLLRNQIPEWASNYINYKGNWSPFSLETNPLTSSPGLKKLIKSAAQSKTEGDEPDLAGMSPNRAGKPLFTDDASNAKYLRS